MSFKILYIEDDINNKLFVRQMLTLTDYQVFDAVDGNSGFELALKEMPDLILVDLNLSTGNGIEVITDLKQSPSLQQIAVIAITSDPSDEINRQCMAAGCVGVIHKPMSRFLLLDTIRRFTDATTSSVENYNNQNADRPLLKKVLIVDDNPDLRAIFARTFDRRHFSVHVAVDGVEAIERLQEELPDVLILDVNMPKLSGFDVLRYVRQNQGTKDVKVVIVTGNYIAMQTPEAEHADLLLMKPVNITDLITLAQRLIPAQV